MCECCRRWAGCTSRCPRCSAATLSLCLFFFFQAEDGIRDLIVTGVQTCALPIYPMGPFELVDLVGLDTRLNILEYLHKSLGEKFRPCPLLVQYVKAGRLGRK